MKSKTGGVKRTVVAAKSRLSGKSQTRSDCTDQQAHVAGCGQWILPEKELLSDEETDGRAAGGGLGTCSVLL